MKLKKPENYETVIKPLCSKCGSNEETACFAISPYNEKPRDSYLITIELCKECIIKLISLWPIKIVC